MDKRAGFEVVRLLEQWISEVDALSVRREAQMDWLEAAHYKKVGAFLRQKRSETMKQVDRRPMTQ